MNDYEHVYVFHEFQVDHGKPNMYNEGEYCVRGIKCIFPFVFNTSSLSVSSFAK